MKNVPRAPLSVGGSNPTLPLIAFVRSRTSRVVWDSDEPTTVSVGRVPVSVTVTIRVTSRIVVTYEPFF